MRWDDPGMIAVRKSADEWLATPEYEGWTVLDPDGWDRRNYDESWAEKLTKAEFTDRLMHSTVKWKWVGLK